MMDYRACESTATPVLEERRENFPVSNALADANKMLMDLCLILGRIEQVVNGREKRESEKPEIPTNLQMSAMMICELSRKCIDMANVIYNGLVQN